jgi:hypothetical protein
MASEQTAMQREVIPIVVLKWSPESYFGTGNSILKLYNPDNEDV